MRILSVDLANIKSYRQAHIPFGLGATAIRGQNGAGKSTVLEAIGFALFDHSPYKQQAQFVREGERIGQITVAFQSALDDRVYEVVRRCGAAAEWYVHDPELRERVAEQSADVTDFLRRHLRIEKEIELDMLFRDALGVPQGTFTADFLAIPSLRKKKFDALLQVEEYAKAATKLGETLKFYNEQAALQDRRIDALERETGQRDDWIATRAEHQSRERDLIADIASRDGELVTIDGERERLRAQAARVERLAAAAQLALTERLAAEERLATATARRDEAQRAAATLAATRADHETYLAAEARLTAARGQARQRDDLRARRQTSEQGRAVAERDAGHASARLAEAKAAGERIIALQPQIAQQTTHEQARDLAAQQVRELATAETARKRTQGDLAVAQREADAARREIAAMEQLRPLAAQLGEWRARLEALQVAEGARAQREQRLAAIGAERRAATEARDKARDLATRAGENVAKILKSASLAAQLPALEQQRADAEHASREVEVEQAHHALSREQSGGGNCPFLREPCLNIQRKGANSLIGYFDEQIAACETRLAPLRERLATLDAQLQQARKAQDTYSKLEYNQERQRDATEACASHEAQLARLADEQAALELAQQSAAGAQALAEARRGADASAAADKRLGALPGQQERLANTEARLLTLSDDAATHDQQIATLADARQRMDAARAALAQLGDPRSESLALTETAKQQEQHAQALALALASRAQCEAELAQFDEALLLYAKLDDELRTLDAGLAQARPGHTSYLQHERMAATFPTMEQAAATANQQAAAATAQHAEAARQHTAAQADYDPARLQQVNALADELRGLQGRANEELRHVQAECARLDADIARVTALFEQLSQARAERQELDEAAKMLQQFREAIKDAGPLVTKALLRRISKTANQIFGEIMGDRAAQIAWEDEYEIVLRHDGRQRTFAQLSGGEQMSAALAVRLALLRELSTLSIAFFDEPTQSMDDERRVNLAEQIRRVRGFDQLIVISHDDTFEQGLDNVIHLDKRNGETVLAEDESLVPVG